MGESKTKKEKKERKEKKREKKIENDKKDEKITGKKRKNINEENEERKLKKIKVENEEENKIENKKDNKKKDKKEKKHKKEKRNKKNEKEDDENDQKNNKEKIKNKNKEEEEEEEEKNHKKKNKKNKSDDEGENNKYNKKEKEINKNKEENNNNEEEINKNNNKYEEKNQEENQEENNNKREEWKEEEIEGEEEERTIYVKNISFKSTENSIYNLFNKINKVKEVRIVNDAKGKSKGFAYVEFIKKEAAVKAIFLSENEKFREINFLLDGRILKCEKANSRKEKTLSEIETNTVFVSNLSENTTDSSLFRFFRERVGEIRDARLVYDRITLKGKGFGYVDFITIEAAKRAINLPKEEKWLDDREILIDFDSKRGKSGGNRARKMRVRKERLKNDFNLAGDFGAKFGANLPTPTKITFSDD